MDLTYFGVFVPALTHAPTLPYLCLFLFFVFFLSGFFFHEHSRFTGLQEKRECISLTPYYHFHLLQKHLDISRAITAESSTLHIASNRTRTGNLWFPRQVANLKLANIMCSFNVNLSHS